MRQFGFNLGLIISVFVFLFLFIKVVGPIPFTVNSVNTQKTDTFNVTGEGKVSVKPDVATVIVGITSNGSTVQVVQEQINITINKISEAIKSLGVAEKDIKTTSYNINPNYDYSSSTQQITGYSASTNLMVKVRKLDTVNNIIDASTKNGANTVSGVNFEVDDKEKAQNEAREKAVAEAKEKAADAAKIAGFKLGKIINYQENNNLLPRVFPGIAYAAMETKDVAAPTQIEPGSTDITISVTLSYEIN